jgi:hypothetical protein
MSSENKAAAALRLIRIGYPFTSWELALTFSQFLTDMSLTGLHIHMAMSKIF